MVATPSKVQKSGFAEKPDFFAVSSTNEKYRPALAGTFRRSLEEEGAFVTLPASRLTLVSLVQP